MHLSPDLPILTERLRLRAFTRGDVEAVHAYRQREDVARYLFDPPMTKESCAEAVQARTAQLAFFEEGDRIVLAVERREDSVLVGEISLIWRNATSGQGEIGYIFNPDHQHQGYAFEAVSALLTLGFGALELHRIFARCDTRNGPSYRLMRRLGMRQEAHFREHVMVKGSWDDEFVCAILADEWRGAANRPQDVAATFPPPDGTNIESSR